MAEKLKSGDSTMEVLTKDMEYYDYYLEAYTAVLGGMMGEFTLSGYVEALGWNQYGGWRIGIRSFDKKRYYYYAHLRQNYPYAEGLAEGSVVTAGDVIGYMGDTGYSTTENVNNIKTVHLHWGLQLIFDESQKEGNNEIWVDCYELSKFLYKNRCEVEKVGDTREWKRVVPMTDPTAEIYRKRTETGVRNKN